MNQFLLFELHYLIEPFKVGEDSKILLYIKKFDTIHLKRKQERIIHWRNELRESANPDIILIK